MIYTVFFEGEHQRPYDCETYAGAVEYAEEKGLPYVIESTGGDVE